MANIGTFGSIAFSVSSRQVNTFDNLQWSNSARYASHDRHLRATLLEFTGTDAGDITFNMYFSAYLGINPDAEIAKVLTMLRTGRAERLIIGRRAYGRSRWVIVSASKGLERFDGRGNLLVASMSVTLREYARRAN